MSGSDWVASNELAFAIRHRSTVRRGHTLIVSRHPIATCFEASAAEKAALCALAHELAMPFPEAIVLAGDCRPYLGKMFLYYQDARFRRRACDRRRRLNLPPETPAA